MLPNLLPNQISVTVVTRSTIYKFLHAAPPAHLLVIATMSSLSPSPRIKLSPWQISTKSVQWLGRESRTDRVTVALILHFIYLTMACE